MIQNIWIETEIEGTDIYMYSKYSVTDRGNADKKVFTISRKCVPRQEWCLCVR